MKDHRALGEDQRPVAKGAGQVTVLGALGLGGVEPAHHPHRGVAHHPPLHLAGRLLGADEDDPQRASALGDVEQDVLDGALPFARGVLVELVEHHEDLSPVPPRLLGLEDVAQERAHHEHLPLGAEAVDVHDIDLCIASQDVRCVARGVTANEVAHVAAGGAQASDEGLQGAGVLAGDPERIALGLFPLRLVAQQLGLDVVHQPGEAVDPGPAEGVEDLTPARALGPVVHVELGALLAAGQRRQLGADVVDEETQVAHGAAVGEEEGQQPLTGEVGHRPVVGVHALAAAAGGGDVPLPLGQAGRGEEGDAGEGLGVEPQPPVALAVFVGQLAVGLVEVEEVLPLDVEDERFSAGRALEHPGVVEAVEQEEGVARLGGHARDAGDVDVPALAAVEEGQVDVGGLAVLHEAHRQPLLHAVVVEGGVQGLAPRQVDRAAGVGWQVLFGVEPGHRHVGHVSGVGGDQVARGEEGVGVELGPFQHLVHPVDHAVVANL